MRQLRLPVGIEDFAEIRRNEYYYVDKTQLIEQVLDRRNKVTLFTRPRRFGKTLNMSMLRYFFEIGTDVKLFEELFIAQNHELCEKYMGKYPVVSISLKSINADSYSKAKAQLIKLVNREGRRVQFLMDSDRLTAVDKALFTALLDREMEEDTLVSSLQELTELLEIHFGQQVIVLIDEYDVPLAKANQNGYYDEMALLLRNFFENVLKTNDSLEFAVLTGCLRIAKESIFTGLNNFKVYSITDADYDEMFGFNDKEVKKMLLTFHQQEKYDEVKEWYDGYRFGNADVYCPWDVVNYCADHLTHPGAVPKNYWLNTSGNEVINRFIDSVDEPQKLAKTELERLVSGNVVRKRIDEAITYKELYSTIDNLWSTLFMTGYLTHVRKRIDEAITYKELYSTIDNLWSTLFMTGYLTQRGCEDDGRYRLVIPNREIQNIVTDHILVKFQGEVKKDGQMADAFCHALMEGKANEVETLFTAYMGKTISIRDTFVRKSIKENFYHGILLGILSFKTGWEVASNRESGTGLSDILIEIDDSDIGIVIEVKYSDDENQLESDCREALKQIKDRDYPQKLRNAGFHKILKYGIACQIKTCKVLVEI